MENIHYADVSDRVATEIKRLETQISKDIHKDIYLVAYERPAPSVEDKHD